jgi:hypothetical protein
MSVLYLISAGTDIRGVRRGAFVWMTSASSLLGAEARKTCGV